MPNNAKFNLTIDAKMTIDDINSALNSIQKGLNKIDVPQKLKSSLSNLFTDLNSDIEKFQEMANSSFTSMSDVNTFSKTFDRIEKSYSSLISSLRQIEGFNIDKLIPKNLSSEVDKAIQSYKEYEQQLKNTITIQKSLGKVQDKITKVTEENERLNNANKNLALDKGRNTQQISSLQKEREELEKTRNSFSKGSSDYQTYNEQIKIINNSINGLINKNKRLDDEIGRNQTTVQVNKSNLKGWREEQEKVNISLQESEVKVQDFRDTFEKLFQSITGEKFSEVSGEIINISQLLQHLNLKGVEKVGQAIDEIDKNAKDGSQSMNNLSDKVSSLEATADAANRAANEIADMSNQAQQFFSISNSFEIFKDIVRQSFEAVKELDAALTETATVTDFSVADMWERVPEYTALAKDLGATITGVANVMTLYYQQGLNTEESTAAGTETLKMARIANMEYADATDLMTSALRGFNMEVNEMNAQRVNDVYSELAAISATDTEELGIAMSKTASIASSANMDFETTAALLAQILETTREAPETA